MHARIHAAGEIQTMNTKEQGKQRLKHRSNVELKAAVSLPGRGPQEHQCRVMNLSATGARLQTNAAGPFTTGMTIDIKIFIPSTVMHIPNSGKIIWIEQLPKGCAFGIKFTEFLSETMMEQLVKR
jgi:hypothetical protein